MLKLRKQFAKRFSSRFCGGFRCGFSCGRGCWDDLVWHDGLSTLLARATTMEAINPRIVGKHMTIGWSARPAYFAMVTMRRFYKHTLCILKNFRLQISTCTTDC